jgi:hypothetical protein
MSNASRTKGTATPIAIEAPFERPEDGWVVAAVAVVVVVVVAVVVVEGIKSEALYRIWTG